MNAFLKHVFKRRKKLYFALVVADRPLEDAKFEAAKDCKMFVTTGECIPKHVIPTMVLKEIVNRFEQPAQEANPNGDVIISEKPV